MTRYHRTWDRRGRLLRACLKLITQLMLYTADHELYDRAKRTANRIKRELEHG